MNRLHSLGRKIILGVLISPMVLGVFWWLGQHPIPRRTIPYETYEKGIEGTSYIRETDGIITEIFFDGTADDPYCITIQAEDREEPEDVPIKGVPCHRISGARYPPEDLKVGQKIRIKLEMFHSIDPEWPDWEYSIVCQSIVVLDEV